MTRENRGLAPESDEEDELEWLLGFVEPPERPSDLLRHRFPSKVGGQPAWLDPVNLPSREQLTCSVTGRLMTFLLQVYAPLDDSPSTFHRTLYLFISPKGDSLSQPGAVRALRCQLPRVNPYYGSAPAPRSQLTPTALQGPALEGALERDPWRVAEAEQAGAAARAGGSKTSSSSRTSSTPAAGTAAGAAGAAGGTAGEAAAAGQGGADAAATAAAPAAGTKASPAGSMDGGPQLLPEFELVVDPEPEEEELLEEGPAGGGGGGQAEEVRRALAAYRARIASEGDLDDEELPPELMDAIEGGGAEAQSRQHFAAFQARVARAPEQVLRYCFAPGAGPLWPAAAGAPSGPPPPCPACGGPRRFEFQVMPQLLALLGQDEEDPCAPDFGAIAVYSCAASCSIDSTQGGGAGSAYIEEYVWVQPTS